jgi:hypothetical protein
MRAKEFETKIKEAGEPETVYQQDIGVGTPQATNSVGTNADTNISPDHKNHITNLSKVQTDDPYTQSMVNPLQQEIEMLKKAAGKDTSNIDHVYQSSNEKGPHIPWDEPLVKQPETMDGEKPGLPADMRKITQSPNSANTGQWTTQEPKAEKSKEQPQTHIGTWTTTNSKTNLGSDTEKRISDAEQIRIQMDKVAASERERQRQASAGATELTTKAGIPSSFGGQQ